MNDTSYPSRDIPPPPNAYSGIRVAIELAITARDIIREKPI